MTVQELMIKVYEESGEPSDRCPYTDPNDLNSFSLATTGAIKLLRTLNTAVQRIANWRFRNNRIIRFRSLFGKQYVILPEPPTGTIADATDTTATLESLGSDTTGELNGWLIEITDGLGVGQTRLIVGTAIAGGLPVISIDTAWDTNPDATSTYKLRKNFFNFVPAATAGTYLEHHAALDPVNTLVDIIKIRDVSSGTDLDRSMKEEFFSGSLQSIGTPSSFKVFGNQIMFDSAIDERKVYEVFYVRQPTLLTVATQEPDIPVSFHEAVSLWAVHEIQRLNQGIDAAYATKRELEDLMEMLRLQGMSDGEFEQGSLLVYE